MMAEIFVPADIVDVGRRDVVKDGGGCVDKAFVEDGTCVDLAVCIELPAEVLEGANEEDCALCESRVLP